jgi:hypothetical protein
MTHVSSITMLLLSQDSYICFERISYDKGNYLRLPFIILNNSSHEACLQNMLPSSYMKSVQSFIVPYSDDSLSSTKVYKHFNYVDYDDLYVKIPLHFFTKNINWLQSRFVHGELISFASCKILRQLLL